MYFTKRPAQWQAKQNAKLKGFSGRLRFAANTTEPCFYQDYGFVHTSGKNYKEE